MVRGSLRVALLLLVVVPLGAAEGTLDGEVTLGAPPRLAGDASFEGGTALDLADPGPARFALSWTHAEGRRVLRNFTGVDGVPLVAGVEDPRVEREPLRFGPGALRGFHCHGPCHVFLVPLAPGEGFALRAPVDGAPELFLEEDLTYAGAPSNSDTSFAHRTPEGAWRVSRGAGGAVAAGNATLALPERVAIVLVNVTFRVAEGARERAFDTRTRWDDASLGPVGTTVERAPHVYLELRGASLDLQPDAPFALHLESPEVRVVGQAGPVTARGWVAEDGRRRALHGHALLLDGDVRLAARPADDSLGPEPATFIVSGEGRVVVDGLQVTSHAATRTAPGVALAAGLLALLVLLGRALLPLYSRIDRSRALDHPSRQRILDVLAESPGSTVEDLRAATGMGRTAVEHHLRVLSMHGLVAVARKGRRRRFHRFDAPPRGLDPRRALADATRRRIARFLAGGGSLTQADLAAATSVSKRLVCYHLARLSEAGLVESVPGFPRRYAGTPTLRGLLDEGPGAAQA